MEERGKLQGIAQCIVEEFRRQLQRLNNPRQAWDATYQRWVSTEHEGVRDPAQSWKSASGKAFELIAQEYI